MKHPLRALFRTTLAGALASCLLLAGGAGDNALARQGGGDDGGGGGGGEETLTLRVNDAIGKPGGTIAVVLRTYAPRPIRQGQVRLKVTPKPRPRAAGVIALPAVSEPVRPLLTLVSAVVYSQRGDSTTTANLTGSPSDQTLNVQFQSPSASVNAADGPLAVFKFRLDPSVAPGQQFDIQVDPAVTSLLDGGGQAIEIDPRPAVLTIRQPAAPYAVESEGDEVAPGEVAELGVQTFEPFLVSGGQMVLRFNPAVLGGTPTVLMDPRYGKSTYTVTRRRGQIIVRFQSPDASLNNVPGTIIAVQLPTRATAAPGSSSAVTIDTSRSYLLNRRGKPIPLRYEAGVITFE